MDNQTATLDGYYSDLMHRGNLRTLNHAARLSSAVLHTLGFNLGRSSKRQLAKALPPELARELTRGWRLVNIRHRKLPMSEFAKDVALHSGNTDPEYAEMVTKVVFRQLKGFLDDDLRREVAKDLSPQVGAYWSEA